MVNACKKSLKSECITHEKIKIFIQRRVVLSLPLVLLCKAGRRKKKSENYRRLTFQERSIRSEKQAQK